MNFGAVSLKGQYLTLTYIGLSIEKFNSVIMIALIAARHFMFLLQDFECFRPHPFLRQILELVNCTI